MHVGSIRGRITEHVVDGTVRRGEYESKEIYDKIGIPRGEEKEVHGSGVCQGYNLLCNVCWGGCVVMFLCCICVV